MAAEIDAANLGFDFPRLGERSREIRLLTVTGWTDDGILSCNLRIVSLDCPPDYTALSYTWGNDNAEKNMQVNGVTYNIRNNLHAFLAEIAVTEMRGTPLFVDAVCINQSDLQEKNHQVPLMRDIYKAASEVIAWLGPWKRHNLELWQKIQLASSFLYLRWILVNSQTVDRRFHESIESLDDDLLIAVTHASSHPYWSRMWVIQEIFSAKSITFRIGNVKFTPMHLLIVTQALYTDSHSFARARGDSASIHIDLIDSSRALKDRASINPLSARMISATLDSRPSQTRVRLYEVLTRWRGQRCKDPRDMVFGLIGMTKTAFLVNYDMTITQLLVTIFAEGLLELSLVASRDPEEHLLLQERFHRACYTAFECSRTHKTLHLLASAAIERCGIPHSWDETWVRSHTISAEWSRRWPGHVLTTTLVFRTLVDGALPYVWIFFPSALQVLLYQRYYSQLLYRYERRKLQRSRQLNEMMVTFDGLAYTYSEWIARIDETVKFLQGSGHRPEIWRATDFESNVQIFQRQTWWDNLLDVIFQLAWACCWVGLALLLQQILKATPAPLVPIALIVLDP